MEHTERGASLIRRELRGALQRMRASVRPKTWVGVYGKRTDVPVVGDGFQSSEWLEQARAATRASMAATSTGSEFIQSDIQLLASLLAGDDSSSRVLDFGGGMGIGYVHVRQALVTPRPLEYVIVDDAPNCRAGRELLVGNQEVRFFEQLPDAAERFDIVYAGSSVQYIEDLPSLLARWTAYRPRWILLGDVPASVEPAFWTGQRTIVGSVIPYHILNLDALVALLAASGFRLVVRGVFRRLRAEIGARRLDCTYNLVFER